MAGGGPWVFRTDILRLKTNSNFTIRISNVNGTIWQIFEYLVTKYTIAETIFEKSHVIAEYTLIIFKSNKNKYLSH